MNALEENKDISLNYVQLALDNGFDINRRSMEGNTLLRNAYLNENEEVLNFLLEQPTLKIADEDFFELISAKPPASLVQLFLEKGANPNAKVGEMSVLQEAVREGDLDIIKLLVNAGADINVQDRYGENLFSSINPSIIDEDPKNIVNFLISQGLKLTDSFFPLLNTLRYRYTNPENEKIKVYVDFLFENYGGLTWDSKDKNGRSFLEDVLEIASVEEIQFLISKLPPKKGLFVKILQDKKITPKFLEKILEKITFDVNEPDETGKVPIVVAFELGNRDIYRMLTEKGAKTNALIKNDTNGRPIVVNLIEKYYESPKHDSIIGGFMNTLVQKKGINFGKQIAAINKKLFSGLSFLDFIDANDTEYFNQVKPDAEKWPGIYQEDLEKWGTIFSGKVQDKDNISPCPVCLTYVERSEACKYMSHVCPENLRHERLYQTYKNEEGKIYWCTICGRHCKGHRHYVLSDGKEDRPVPLYVIPPGVVANVFSADDCPKEGGGGFPEKVARIQDMITKAEKLEDEVGKISVFQAQRQLIEAAWNRTPKGFVISSKFKKTPAPTVVADVPRKAEDKDLLPVKVEDTKDCLPYLGEHEDGRPVFRFRHRKPDGTINEHMDEYICYLDMLEGLRSTFLTDKGKCPISPECGAIVHPDEIKAIKDGTPEQESPYQNYRESFNAAYKPMTGGAERRRLFVHMDNAECVVPFKNKGGKKKSFKRKLVKRHRTYKKKTVKK